MKSAILYLAVVSFMGTASFMQTRRRAAMKVVFVLLLGLISNIEALTQEKDKNTITVGPGYKKGQVSENKLSFVIPNLWSLDKEAADKMGIYAVILPKGKTIDNTDKVITIAFQKKDPNIPELENLTDFFRADMQKSMAQFADMQGAKWQPSGLDPNKITFMSIEVFGKKKDQPSPHHLLMIDAGDGYFSITLTAETVRELHQSQYEQFFNSIRLQ